MCMCCLHMHECVLVGVYAALLALDIAHFIPHVSTVFLLPEVFGTVLGTLPFAAIAPQPANVHLHGPSALVLGGVSPSLVSG
jgi:hypothetical protein